MALTTRLRKPAVAEEISLPVCTSCKRIIAPHEKSVSFPCPNCGKYVIRRCYRCRTSGVPYRCPVCGFEGP
ncbi:MAG: zinc finger domain-containing protein [Sulfolobales archaeon]